MVACCSFIAGPTLGDIYDLMLVLRSQVFGTFACNVSLACLGSTWNRFVPEKKTWEKNGFSLRERLFVAIVDLCERRWLVGPQFRR